ncbi:MAG: phosphoribosylformylglycinamidine synthase subunit PurS [Pseudomonadota bacterium]|nr:phosphoribosylformylglycinamidine synthase subunit PurS [Pseudomonadota bacterium]|tara:strand:- start:140 stop:385 length:246 start_codon:yes stop_codon:yes gene_type:complete
MVKAIVHISLKHGVLDPEGKAIQNALDNFGFQEIKEIRKGKFIEIMLNESDKSEAKDKVDKMCRKLLVNTVIENYKIEVVD